MQSYEEKSAYNAVCNLIRDTYATLDTFKHDWDATEEERQRDWERHQLNVQKRVLAYKKVLAKMRA